MKVLITGKNGYIANKTESWLKKCDDSFEVDFLNMKDPEWVKQDLSSYDAIVHTAAIVHIKCDDEKLYDNINNKMTIELAMKAKESGVNHFIFLSSMSVYSFESGLKKENLITLNTYEKPLGFYGISKLKAEEGLEKLNDDSFVVSTIRPPMVYGPKAKGNYQRLSKLARLLWVSPNIKNQRSMIYVDNLTEFIRVLLTKKIPGVFYPQNSEYVSTYELIRTIRKCHGKKTLGTCVFNPLIVLMAGMRGGLSSTLNKLFGNLTYSKDISNFEFDYNVVTFEESIRLCEGKKDKV